MLSQNGEYVSAFEMRRACHGDGELLVAVDSILRLWKVLQQGNVDSYLKSSQSLGFVLVVQGYERGKRSVKCNA